MLFPEIRCLDDVVSSSENRLVGIVGDPNSGKSVFVGLLENAGKNAGKKIWAFDCDYAAPTPKWYLRMLRSGQETAGVELRKQYKKQWTHEAEIQMAEVLGHLKRHLPLVIADLPGGRHPKDEPPENALRIPDGREVMLQPVDYFIIIARKDRDSERLWTEALARFGLRNRILLTVWSEAPEAEPELTFLDSGHIRMKGLSRKQSSFPPALCGNLWKIVQEALSRAELPAKIQ